MKQDKVQYTWVAHNLEVYQYYKIAQSYVAYDVLLLLYKIEPPSIPYDTTKSCATKSQHVQAALRFECSCIAPYFKSGLSNTWKRSCYHKSKESCCIKFGEQLTKHLWLDGEFCKSLSSLLSFAKMSKIYNCDTKHWSTCILYLYKQSKVLICTHIHAVPE